MSNVATVEETQESKKNKPTVGEELFLVHLKRCRDEEEDHDHITLGRTATPRKRTAFTVGEELWEIHVKRSRGMEEEEEDEAGSNNGSQHHEQDGKRTTATNKVEESKCTRYNLRSKDGSTKKA
mmetsp:Transcript_7163/g.11329  ORF Transcript_7163/g.11329 Transcript_7163/m.11329 type:complete len:124 (-) Transcript_7163:915-1286(-)